MELYTSFSDCGEEHESAKSSVGFCIDCEIKLSVSDDFCMISAAEANLQLDDSACFKRTETI